MIFTIHLNVRTFNSNRESPDFPFVFHSSYVYMYFILTRAVKSLRNINSTIFICFLFTHILPIPRGNQGFHTGSRSTHFESHWTPTCMNPPKFCGQATSWRSYANRMVRNEHLSVCSYAWSVVPLDITSKTQAQRFSEHVESGRMAWPERAWSSEPRPVPCPLHLLHLAIPELDPYSDVINR